MASSARGSHCRSVCESIAAVDDNSDDADVEVSTEEINIVVAQLKRITRCANLEFALRVGAVIIHHFYDGDASAWRFRGVKNASFRRLAQHPELPLSPGSLYRCVALFELCDRLNCPSRWEHLGASHLRMVLGLSPEVQEKLLTQANANRWTVKTFQSVILANSSARVTRGGRRADPVLLKSLRTVRRSVEAHRGVIELMEEMSAQDIDQTIQLLEETRHMLTVMCESLQFAQAQPRSQHALEAAAAPKAPVQNYIANSRSI